MVSRSSDEGVSGAPAHLGELLDRACARGGAGSPALSDGRVRLTWAEYRDRAARLAASMRAAGVGVGDRVAVHLPKSADSFVAVHAVLRAGAVVVPLDWFAPVEHLRSVLVDAGATALVSRARQSALDELVATTPVRTVLDPLVEDGPALPPQHLAGSDPAYIIFSSGSTGRPKGIVQTHDSALAYARLAVETYGLVGEDRMANIAPLQFDQSTFELYAAPLAGASVLVVPDAVMRFPASLAELVADEQVTVWYSVPYALRQLHDRGVLENHDLSRLRWILYGGEEYPPTELAALMRAIPSARVSNVYGPAEVNQCSHHHLDAPPSADAPIPIGRAWSGSELVLIEDAQIVTGPGRGELWVAAATMMDRYWNRPDLTAHSIVEEHPLLGAGRWYRTGDLVERRTDGELVFLGRVDNQVKVRGYRIELEGVEATLADHDSVEGCAVLVESDTETLVAIVEPALDDATLETVRTTALASLPRHSVPARFVSVARLPRTSTGKVDRSSARRVLDADVNSARPV